MQKIINVSNVGSWEEYLDRLYSNCDENGEVVIEDYYIGYANGSEHDYYEKYVLEMDSKKIATFRKEYAELVEVIKGDIEEGSDLWNKYIKPLDNGGVTKETFNAINRKVWDEDAEVTKEEMDLLHHYYMAAYTDAANRLNEDIPDYEAYNKIERIQEIHQYYMSGNSDIGNSGLIGLVKGEVEHKLVVSREPFIRASAI